MPYHHQHNWSEVNWHRTTLVLKIFHYQPFNIDKLKFLSDAKNIIDDAKVRVEMKRSQNPSKILKTKDIAHFKTKVA